MSPELPLEATPLSKRESLGGFHPRESATIRVEREHLLLEGVFV